MPDQENIPFPRIGFAGVIDERLDVHLLEGIAGLRPEWQFIMVGPVVKIEQDDLPTRSNIHYLGGKHYADLPKYMSGWQVAMMPFALNESTRYISPTKTPEYLAAGLPVVSTPIRDVIRPYGDEGLVSVAATAEEFCAGIEAALAVDISEHFRRSSEFLSAMSWDKTYGSMADLIDQSVSESDPILKRSQGSLDNLDAIGAKTLPAVS